MTTKKVMVVDDSHTVQALVSSAFANHGFSVICASDGMDAIEKLSMHDDVVLIFCDVNMPRMSGLEMVSEVKRMQKYVDIPVVMLTTEGRPELMRRAKEAGASAWIVKPFKPEQLVAVVKKLVERTG
ncbi:MAG: response regulator [Deltaproteobacteria bacterium]|nr:response regulator [Deltaproteobacteria bacterium]